MRALSLILHLVPDSIKLAVVVGMGLLLSFIGLQVCVGGGEAVGPASVLVPPGLICHPQMRQGLGCGPDWGAAVYGLF